MCPFKPRSTFLAAWSLFWLAAATAAAQSLPTPRHAFDFGYYFVDGKYGPNASLANPNPTYWNEVGCYTSLYYATLVNYDSDFTPVQQLSLLEQSVARAANQGKAVVLALDLPKELASKQSDEPECTPSVANPAWEFSSKLYTNLQEARGLIEQVWEYWPQVQRLELVDEPNFAAGWTKEGIDCYTARIKELLFELHLGQRPIGLTHQANAYAALQGQRISGSQLDWVGVSAYMKAEDQNLCASERQAIFEGMMENAIARLGDKPIVFVMQAYDTNGCFTNLDALIDLQLWTYELAATESVGALSFVTDGLLMFNYARSNAGGAVCGSGEGGGTRFYPEIKATHELMAEKIFGRTMPALCGRPTPALPATSACPTPDPS